jgi:hypothetical protein
VQFGIRIATSIRTADIITPIGKIQFYIIYADTPFLLYLVDIDRRPSKSDSAPIRGNGYKPGLRSLDPEPTQRRRIACGQDLVVVVGVEGGGKKFSDGEILKTTTIGPL